MNRNEAVDRAATGSQWLEGFDARVAIKGMRAMTADTILDVNGTGNQSDPDSRSHMSTGKPPLIVIVGPTASGKTGVGLRLASHFPIEIVNADSRAFYRGMDVGTAKPTSEERARVPHHLIDILDPDEPMSISLFQELALSRIADIHSRRHIPVLVGGTPQYVNALVEGWNIPRVEPNHQRRRELERRAEVEGVESVLRDLATVDPVTALKTGPNLRRIIRALEVFEGTGVQFSQLQTRGDVPFAAIEFELWLPRDDLYSRIDQRVDEMIANGLVEEVRSLLARGYNPDLPAFSSIGYRQLMPGIADESDLGEAIERIKIDTHRLVRHQQTWFRRNDRLIRIDMTDPGAFEQVVSYSIDFCAVFVDHDCQ